MDKRWSLKFFSYVDDDDAQCDQMLEEKVAQFLYKKVAQKVATIVESKKYVFFVKSQNSTCIWANFARKCVPKSFQKSPNLVTLTSTATTMMTGSEIMGQRCLSLSLFECGSKCSSCTQEFEPWNAKKKICFYVCRWRHIHPCRRLAEQPRQEGQLEVFDEKLFGRTSYESSLVARYFISLWAVTID